MVDHHQKKGIPYTHQIEGEAEEDPEDGEGGLIKTDATLATKDTQTIKKPKKAKGSFFCINSNWLRKLVSTNKRRLATEGYNLDLTYITNRVIACGFPADGLEQMYRNRRVDIRKFLFEKHGSMCKIYNLCAEAKYQYRQEEVKEFSLYKFPFCDHQIAGLNRVFQFCVDAGLFLQRMEQYHRANRSKLPKNQQPVIVVHCKAGKGRTGMMICSLLLFLGLFSSSEKAIKHYNAMRAVNQKALTICSQKRYVKFFEGFLNYKLTENVPADDKLHNDNYFEVSLRRHNYLAFNTIFEDMSQERLEMSSFALGPFPAVQSNFSFEIALLVRQQEVKTIFNFSQWKAQNSHLTEEKLKTYYEWFSVKPESKDGSQTQPVWYLRLNLSVWEQVAISDFRIKYKSNFASFYMWLNVSAILWNEKLKKITIEKNREAEPFELSCIEEVSNEIAQNEDQWTRLSLPQEAANLNEIDSNGGDLHGNQMELKIRQMKELQQILADQENQTTMFYQDEPQPEAEKEKSPVVHIEKVEEERSDNYPLSQS